MKLPDVMARFALSRDIHRVHVDVFEFQRANPKHRTMKKTRKYTIDGVEVTSTTTKVINDVDLKNEKEKRVLRWVAHKSTLLFVYTCLEKNRHFSGLV